LITQAWKLTIIERIIRLKSFEIFEQTKVEQLAEVATLTQEFFFETGATLYLEGQGGDAFYFLLDGCVILEKNGITAFELKAGEIIGTLSALDHQPHLFSAKARLPLHVLKLDAGALQQLLSRNNEFALAVIRLLCRLIREHRFPME
jgi:CRP/FNR family transcriptional regulator